MPKESLGALTEVLKQLCVASSQRRSEEQAKQHDLRTFSSFLLQPEAAIPSLSDLSQQDCEVNAPVDRQTLLQGADLLTALDYADSLAV